MRELWRNLTQRRPRNSASDEPPTGDPAKVLIYTDEADRVAQLTMQYPRIETGGDLFGYWTHSGSPVISFVIGPGRRSRHNLTSFYQDEEYLHAAGIDLYDRHGLQHIGEWHSHHRLALNEPSEGDIGTVRSGMTQKDWRRFVLLITTINSGAAPVFQNYFLFTDNDGVPAPLRILPLPGASPFRTSGHDSREEDSDRSGHVSWRAGPFTPGTLQRPEDVFQGAWFTSAEGKSMLVRAARQFGRAGISCRMIPTPDGRSLKLVLPDATIVLGAQFPHEPPQWLGEQHPRASDPWSPSADLLDWYMKNRHTDANGNSELAEGKSGDGTEDQAGRRDTNAE